MALLVFLSAWSVCLWHAQGLLAQGQLLASRIAIYHPGTQKILDSHRAYSTLAPAGSMQPPIVVKTNTSYFAHVCTYHCTSYTWMVHLPIDLVSMTRRGDQTNIYFARLQVATSGLD